VIRKNHPPAGKALLKALWRRGFLLAAEAEHPTHPLAGQAL
jgi:hypothetical protein